MLLSYLVPSAATIAFILGEPLHRDAFQQIVHILGSSSEPADDQRSSDMHWNELERRALGTSRWDAVAPWPPPALPTKGLVTAEILSGIAKSRQTVQNILAVRQYRRFQLGDYVATIDLLNPADELELGYAGAGEPVVCLLLAGPRTIQDDLATVPGIYDLLLKFDDVLRPISVAASAGMATPLTDYADGSIDASISPWSFLHPLSVIEREAGFPSDHELAKSFSVVKGWPRNRLLLQALPGLGLDIVAKYSECAKLVGRRAVQETLDTPSKVKRTRTVH